MASFNIRLLIVFSCIFNTNVINAVVLGRNSMPGGFSGFVAEQTMHFPSSGKLVPDGDMDKAMKALYQVVSGESAGVGREVEQFLAISPPRHRYDGQSETGAGIPLAWLGSL